MGPNRRRAGSEGVAAQYQAIEDVDNDYRCPENTCGECSSRRFSNPRLHAAVGGAQMGLLNRSFQ